MTTARVTPARPSFARRAVIALALAFGVALTALPAQEASAASLERARAQGWKNEWLARRDPALASLHEPGDETR